MIRRIIEHNAINGVVFSTVQFLFVAAAATVIGISFGLRHEWVGLIMATGTTINCLVAAAFGAAAWRRGYRGSSLRNLLSAKYRAELSHAYPTMMKDAVTLAASTIVPYVLLGSVVADWGGRKG